MKAPLDSRQLNAFCIVVRTGSFTAAARELFLSQSAISHSIKALENEVGCRLLDRMGRKISPTLAGEQLFAHAEKIFREMEAARSALSQLGKWGRSRLRLGATTTACQYIVPSVLREFRESFPQSLITIEPRDVPELVTLLDERRIDLALAPQPQQHADFEFLPLFSDELVFLVAPQHEWAATRKVKTDEIPRQNYILYHRQSHTFRLIEQHFARDKIVLNTYIELGSVEAIKELVKLGLGVGILARWVAQKELAEGSLVALPPGRRRLTRQWGILHARGRRLSLAEETFIGLCRSATEAGIYHAGLGAGG